MFVAVKTGSNMSRGIARCVLIVAVVWCTSATAKTAQIPLESYLASQTAIRASVNGHDGLFLFDTGEGVSKT